VIVSHVLHLLEPFPCSWESPFRSGGLSDLVVFLPRELVHFFFRHSTDEELEKAKSRLKNMMGE